MKAVSAKQNIFFAVLLSLSAREENFRFKCGISRSQAMAEAEDPLTKSVLNGRQWDIQDS